jgi:glycosyltransferase involved in cell wall biosynthesis
MTAPLHIVEPTLNGDAGHCNSLVRALAGAAAPHAVTVWAGVGAGPDWPPHVRLQRHFHRRWRRLQAYALYRQLLRQPGRILVSTAGSSDLVTAHWAAAGVIPPHKLFLFVHWLGGKTAKAGLWSALARKQPHIEILAPTASVADFFRNCGFHSTVVPYPVETAEASAPAAQTIAAAGFTHLLVAGGARIDKGFAHVVDLVCELQRRGLDLPIVVQASSEQRHQHDPVLAAALARLRGSGYAGLTLVDDTLGPAAYRALFDGAVVLQPYALADFKDRVSGVTLDALGAGAPVVVTDGTWMAALVRRFDAGVACADLSAAGLLAAITQVLADHVGYAARARVAAASVRAEFSAQALIATVLQHPDREPRTP